MFKKNHVLKNDKQLEIMQCGNNEIPYIKSLKNIMNEEVQSIAHMGTYQKTKVYFFKKLTAKDDYAELPISYGLSFPKNIFLLAVIDSEIAGYIKSTSMWKNEKEPGRKNLMLFDIEVINKYKNLGVDSLLIEALKECGAENGYENIYSECRTNSTWTGDNSDMINLFLNTGATELNNINIMNTVIFGEEEVYEELPNIDYENLDENSQLYLERRAKSYKWRIK